MKNIHGINSDFKKMVFVGALSTLAFFRSNDIAHAQEFKTTSGPAIDVTSKESNIEDILNLELKTNVEDAESTIAHKKLKSLQDKKSQIFAYKEFLSENTDGTQKNDVIIAYCTKKGILKLGKGLGVLDGISKDSNSKLENFAYDLDQILNNLSDTEKNELFEIVKTKYTEFIESKDWKDTKKEELLRLNLQEFEKDLGIYKIPTETHFFTEIEDAEDANFWYELKELEGKFESIYEKRSINLNGNTEPRKKLDTPKITQENTILACVEYTNSEGERDIAYMYIANSSKSGTVRCTQLDGLTDEEKRKLLELANEKYEQILEEKDTKLYKYIDDWDSKIKVVDEHFFSSFIKKPNKPYEDPWINLRHNKDHKEQDEEDTEIIHRHSKDYEEENETTKETHDTEEEKNTTTKDKEHKTKDEKNTTTKDTKHETKDEKTTITKDTKHKIKDEKSKPNKEQNKNNNEEMKIRKENQIKNNYEDNSKKTNNEQSKIEIKENFRADNSIYNEKTSKESLKKEEIKPQKARGEVRIGDKPPEKSETNSKKLVSLDDLKILTDNVTSEEINKWVDTLEKEINHALDKQMNEKGEENEK